MEIIKLGVPFEAYFSLQNTHVLTEPTRDALKKIISDLKLKRIVLFGAENTGKILRYFIGEQFCGYVNSATTNQLKRINFDGLVISTAPVHYDSICRDLEMMLLDRDIYVITIFNSAPEVDIRLVLETQPRSGTHYTIENLMKCCKWGYGSVFEESADGLFVRSRDKRFGIVPKNGDKKYVIKAHFYQPLHYPEYRYTKTLFLISYLFDAYHSWGRMMAEAGPDYHLRETSKEWATLRGYISLNRKWLAYIRDRFVVRYEDYFIRFDETIKRMSLFLDEKDLIGFSRPRSNSKRMYWACDYERHMDRSVFESLRDSFQAELSYYWPEKTNVWSF